MAQNVTLMGASYSNVPAVTLPKTGGGTARFDDATVTTATASDVAQGKVFLASDGTITTGTASGGGGASNIVEGTFTTPSSAGASSVNIPYTGSGYPISCIVVVEGGAYVSGTGWYNSMQRYAVGQCTMTKSVFSSSPTYGTSGTQNQGVTTWVYKNSTSSSTSYSRSSAMNTNVFSSSNASNAGATCIRLKSGNVLSYYTNTSSYGLLPSTTYRYIITYSS